MPRLALFSATLLCVAYHAVFVHAYVAPSIVTPARAALKVPHISPIKVRTASSLVFMRGVPIGVPFNATRLHGVVNVVHAVQAFTVFVLVYPGVARAYFVRFRPCIQHPSTGCRAWRGLGRNSLVGTRCL